MLESMTQPRVRWLTWSVVAAGLALLLAGCSNRAGPEEYEFHDHRLVLKTRSINQSADTSGVTRLRVPLHGTDCHRNWGGPGPAMSQNTLFPAPLWIDVLRPDTEFAVCTSSVRHYTGYQLKYGGDTMRFSCLDSDTTWSMCLFNGSPEVQLDSGDRVALASGFLYAVPDTVRGAGALELEVTYDLDGLFLVESVPVNMQLVTMRSEKIHYRQR